MIFTLFILGNCCDFQNLKAPMLNSNYIITFFTTQTENYYQFKAIPNKMNFSAN